MSDGGFNNGLLGIPGAGPNNAAGLMFHMAMRNSNDDAPPPKAEPIKPCKPGEVRWHSAGDCFVPGQVHINMIVTESIVIVVLLFIIVFMWGKK